MFYFFVSFPIITDFPAIYNSYFRKICHGLRSFPTIECTLCEHSIVMKKRMCLGTFSRRGAVALATIYPCAECASSRSIFIVWKRSFLYDNKECLGTFSRRGAVASATIYPCAECASSRSIFIVWKRSFLYDNKECLGTFSRRGAVASATIYPCAECASSRSIFIVWKRSFLYDKKGMNLFFDSSLSNRVLLSPDTAHIAYWLLYSVA